MGFPPEFRPCGACGVAFMLYCRFFHWGSCPLILSSPIGQPTPWVGGKNPPPRPPLPNPYPQAPRGCLGLFHKRGCLRKGGGGCLLTVTHTRTYLRPNPMYWGPQPTSREGGWGGPFRWLHEAVPAAHLRETPNLETLVLNLGANNVGDRGQGRSQPRW